MLKVKQVTQATLPDIDIKDIKFNTHLRDHLGLDSIDSMSLIIAFEQEFGIVIPDSKVKEMSTVEQAVIIIEEHLKKIEDGM